MAIFKVCYDLENKATNVTKHYETALAAESEAAAKALARKHLYFMRGWPLRKNNVRNMTAERIGG